jgi:hypothetical protein
MRDFDCEKMSNAKDKKLSAQIFDEIDFTLPIVEAIVNSIQANAQSVNIEIIRTKQPAKDSMLPDDFIDVIDKIIISDTGNGFLANDRESFNTICGTKKDNCKGLGRLSFLQVFDNVAIESCFLEDGEYKMLNFPYDGENLIDDTSHITLNHSCGNGTQMTFSNINSKFTEDIKQTDEQIFNKIKRKIIPSLISKQCKIIFNNNINLSLDFSNDRLQTIEDKDLQDKGYRIQYTYYNSNTDSKDDNFFLFYAQDRAISEVFNINPSFQFNSEFGNKIILLVANDDFKINGIIKPDWSGFKIEQRKFREMKEFVQNKIFQFLKDKTNLFTKIDDIKKDVKKERPDLEPFVNYLDNNLSFTNKGEYEVALKEKREEMLKTLFIANETFDSDEYISVVAQSALAELMISRFRTLKNTYDICNDKKTLEKEIHNIFIKNDINNFWLLDPRWQYADLISSDDTIKKIWLKENGINENDTFLNLLNKNNILTQEIQNNLNNKDFCDEFNKRPDIAIFNEESVIIIELKKPDIDLSMYIHQPQYYARLISYLNDKKYKRFYCYLIGSDLPALADLNLTVDKQGRFKTESKMKVTLFENNEQEDKELNSSMYFEVCTYNKFLKDCYVQLHPYFEKIGRKIDALEKFIPRKQLTNPPHSKLNQTH